MMQWGGIRAFARLAGEMRFNFYGDQIEVKFDSRVGEPWESWLRLKYAMADHWTGEEVEIDDKIFLATTLAGAAATAGYMETEKRQCRNSSARMI
jgi:hypothetical protein